MMLPGRYGSTSEYRYGFNGYEKDDEISGEGNSYTTEFRQYDARIGRWKSTDPVVHHNFSPYNAFDNSPILLADPNGADSYDWVKPQGSNTWSWDANVNSQADATAKYGAGTEYGPVGHIYNSVEGLIELGDNGSWSKFEARDEYEQAIVKGHYTYTQNYGWVDMSHAFYGDGAATLISNVTSENGFESITGNGFIISYQQSARVVSFMPRVGPVNMYMVNYGLTKSQALSVAMGIFQETSIEFESLQGLAWWSGSSFEPSDLTSNLLGFYVGAGIGLTKDKVLELIEPVDVATSLNIYRMYPGTFTDPKYKNYTFSPVFFPNPFTTSNPQVPSILQSIQPAAKGNLYQDVNMNWGGSGSSIWDHVPREMSPWNGPKW